LGWPFPRPWARATDLIHIDRAWAAPSWDAGEPGVLFLRIVN
jgi:hypothetical protein